MMPDALMQAALLLVAGRVRRSALGKRRANRASDRPFAVSEVARSAPPWAMAFLPGSGVPLTNTALVTEKTGQDVAGRCRERRKQQVAGVPRVVVVEPGRLARRRRCRRDFAGDQQVYLTYAEPSANGGSGLALARAQLVDIGTGRRGSGPAPCCGATRRGARAGSSARSSPSRPTASRCS